MYTYVLLFWFIHQTSTHVWIVINILRESEKNDIAFKKRNQNQDLIHRKPLFVRMVTPYPSPLITNNPYWRGYCIASGKPGPSSYEKSEISIAELGFYFAKIRCWQPKSAEYLFMFRVPNEQLVFRIKRTKTQKKRTSCSVIRWQTAHSPLAGLSNWGRKSQCRLFIYSLFIFFVNFSFFVYLQMKNEKLPSIFM